MINIILWIVFGALIGWVASLIMGTDDEQGAVANIAFGVLGAIIGGFIARFFGADGVTGFNITSFIVSLGGAILLIWIYRMFSRRMG